MNKDSEAGSSLLLYYDGATILDPDTHRFYRRTTSGEVDLSESLQGHYFNAIAGGWSSSLELSDLLEGESEPPEGQVGQYGQWGCVLSEWNGGMTDSVNDVVLFLYESDGLDRFLKEIKQKTGTRFREAATLESGLYEGGLHPLTMFAWIDDEQDKDEPEHDALERALSRRCVVQMDDYDQELQINVYAALVWGRAHARRLEQKDAQV